MKRAILWVPLALFSLFFGVVAYGLINPGDRTITSKMVGKPVPEFTLPAAYDGRAGLSSKNFVGGEPKLLNIFASWCLPCIAEAPILEAMAKQGVTIHGIAIRDNPADLGAFLARNGNPYAAIGADMKSGVQLAMGSSGVPETFVVDAKGIIRYQHIGDVRADDVPKLMEELRKAR
ncbi:DsbE family thiol:disulfide interchange protein [Sphingomonas sp. C3-2]|uniref:DsbE family thiol:disulfide interchange protein n=1 Tax=Sphingomonas sp. C3-2 TaxID=3062169 RepID=UPI00294B0DDA|nr:DsbE family thiol:disulfide interchange protein [Sphingomonas sp. C3-2]WOK36817.1 DsbE family thiol:disulfide interchange protein [Sphingomonas sp. C3-2]